MGFLRQAANALHASKLRDQRAKRAKEAKGATPRPKTPAPAPPVRPLVVDGVTIEYTPSLDGDPDPGEVVWAWVPYEDDPTQGKDRPIVVVGRNRKGLVGIALTSKRRDHEPQVPVGTGPWDREGRPSYAKLDRLIPLNAREVRREGAILDRPRFDDVIEGLRRLHDS